MSHNRAEQLQLLTIGLTRQRCVFPDVQLINWIGRDIAPDKAPKVFEKAVVEGYLCFKELGVVPNPDTEM